MDDDAVAEGDITQLLHQWSEGRDEAFQQLLRVYLGCTAEDTAEILAISKATVDRELTLARAWLRRELRPDEQPAPRRPQEPAAKPRSKTGA